MEIPFSCPHWNWTIQMDWNWRKIAPVPVQLHMPELAFFTSFTNSEIQNCFLEIPKTHLNKHLKAQALLRTLFHPSSSCRPCVFRQLRSHLEGSRVPTQSSVHTGQPCPSPCGCRCPRGAAPCVTAAAAALHQRPAPRRRPQGIQ